MVSSTTSTTSYLNNNNKHFYSQNNLLKNRNYCEYNDSNKNCAKKKSFFSEDLPNGHSSRIDNSK